VSSIASSRRGRPTGAKDSDFVTIVADFRPTIHSCWRERFGELPDPGEIFELQVDCLSPADRWWNEKIQLDATLAVPKDSKIPNGPIPVFCYTLTNRSGVIDERHIVAGEDTTTLNLISARTASEEEIHQALHWTPPEREEDYEQPSEPTFKRLERTEGDSASYLGFSLGANDRAIRLSPGRWTVVGFHLVTPQVVGRISTSLAFQGHDRLDLRLFNSCGTRVLHLELNGKICFDEIRLDAGDYLLAFRCAGPMEGRGGYNYPHSRVIPDLPERPLLNDIVLWPARSNEPDEVLGQCAVPAFHFAT